MVELIGQSQCYMSPRDIRNLNFNKGQNPLNRYKPNQKGIA